VGQHFFTEEVKRTLDALWLLSRKLLEGKVEHANPHLIPALLDLLDDRFRTANKRRGQTALPDGLTRRPGDIASI
jgi:hypothetical protein